jgi:unsaturated chondroitin disaccharide hydrolase
MHTPRQLPLLSCLALLPAILTAAEPPMSAVIRESFDTAAAQYTRMLEHMKGKPGFPRTVENGAVKIIRAADWTSGFFPGSLWYLFEATGDAKWREAAQTYTAGVESAKDNTGTHDVGFILNCSFGNGLRLTGDPKYREVMLQGAASLSTRFKPEVGCILSWNPRRGWVFPVIVDNMMNLELLTWASRTGGDPKFRDIAVKHADTTMRHHYRADFSSFHVVDYDPATGQVKARQTHQGAADDSAWARGQSWGLYGYTMMYRETKNPAYRAQAQKIAGFLMNHPRLPADKVPYWDYDAPGIPNVPRDSSAAAIMCSALFELSTLTTGDAAARYRTFATQQLRSLASPAYRAKVGENGNFLLMHATGHLPGKSEIDVPINYGDYYFLEALHRCQKLERKS